jgi:DNA polymerase-3 subunit epsilon/ATP-dependent DNA helicase DinG
MPVLVSLDIETTGLDPKSDSIIEIGAVKFNENRVLDEFSTLINPRKPINSFITNLTGITNAMVMNAPLLADVYPELETFIGDHPILGQNVGFDISFFQRYSAFKKNPLIDTYELAAVLMPGAPRYNLGSLCYQLGVMLSDAHRAINDARATMGVYNKLYEKLYQLPIDLIAEMVKQSQGLGWAAELPFRWVLQGLIQQGIQPKRVLDQEGGLLFEFGKPVRTKPLQPDEELQPINVEDLAAMLEPGGAFSQHITGFEHRSQQVEMLRAVGNALNEGQHLMVEAGTGTGKSLAYLIPGAAWALTNKERVVISTNTIALQDQLIQKDIPDLIEATGLDIQAAVLKGRSNYLCPRRFNAMRRRKPENLEELRVIGKVLVWLQTSQSGDRSELNLNGTPERLIWSRISAEDEGCKLETCLKRTGGRCPFYKARMAAESAHILVVNHALLLADAATENRVLPAYNYLIIDEAHHLESATTDAMAYRLRAQDVNRLVRDLGSHEQGLMGRLLSAAYALLKPSDLGELNKLIAEATDRAFRFDTEMTAYFRALDNLLLELREGKPLGTYPQQTRILSAIRTMPAWLDVEISWEQAASDLDALLKILRQIREGLRGLEAMESEDAEDLLGTLAMFNQNLSEIREEVESLTMDPQTDQIYWVELDPLQGRLTLQIAPLHIGTLMEKYLWHEKASIILTSATLTAHGEFDYLRKRLNGEDADELMVGSPFDYEHSALVYLPTDIVEPNDSYGHQRTIDETVIRLAVASGGRMLVLFTSYAQLQKTSKAIQAPLAKHDITVFEQGEGASATALLDTFKDTPRAVLLGTRAFWEGVDVPGEALSVLVIAKLPFDVPSDPIIAARSESFDDPFNEYNLPEAILRFRQGFGRLIRTQTDRGVVVILDKRVITKPYGRLFIESLPQCTFIQASIANLPEKAARWLGL